MSMLFHVFLHFWCVFSFVLELLPMFSVGRWRGERERKNLQTMMRSSAQCRKQSKVFRKRTIKEVINFTNMTCRTSRWPSGKSRKLLRYTSCSSRIRWWMCSWVAMTSACNSGVENTIGRFSPRSSTSTGALLSGVVRTSAHDSVVQEDCGVPNGTEDSRFSSSGTRDSCQVSTIQTVQKFSKMLTGVKSVTQGAACVKVDHEVSVDASVEQLKAISEKSKLEHVEEWT